jgi:bifunctional non-homologous end joining protein LigD
MPDQLSLALDSTLPNLPALRPMLARPATEPFDSPDHLFEPAWGGVRALAFVGPGDAPGRGAIRFVDIDGAPITATLPELAGMASRVAARSAVLDGELVVVDAQGRSDADAIVARLAGRPGRPVAYLAFDALDLDGLSLIGRPLVRRRELLRSILRPGDEVLAVPAFPTEGRALFDAAVAQGIAGVMARHRSSPYLPGVRSRLWRFIATDAGAIERTAGAEVTAPEAPDDDRATAPDIALIRRLPLPLDEIGQGGAGVSG